MVPWGVAWVWSRVYQSLLLTFAWLQSQLPSGLWSCCWAWDCVNPHVKSIFVRAHPSHGNSIPCLSTGSHCVDLKQKMITPDSTSFTDSVSESGSGIVTCQEQLFPPESNQPT